jgi:hypothetical protein
MVLILIMRILFPKLIRSGTLDFGRQNIWLSLLKTEKVKGNITA